MLRTKVVNRIGDGTSRNTNNSSNVPRTVRTSTAKDTMRSLSTKRPEHATVLPQIMCTGCMKRVGSYNSKVRKLMTEGFTAEQAFDIADIKRYCCRAAIMSDIVIPPTRAFDPEASRGIKSEGDPFLKWNGHMKIYTEDDEDEPRPDDSWVGSVPDGYKFLKWLAVPGINGQPDSFVMKIVRVDI